MNWQNKKVFLFDMDGLLVDTESIHLRIWRELFQQKELAVSDEQLFSTIGVSAQKERQILSQALGSETVFDACLSEKEPLMERYLAQHGLPVKPGAKELLTFLKAQHWPYILVSSSSAAAVAHYLALAGLADLLEERVCGDQVKEAKPHPEIYLLALQRYHLAATACLAFEDSKNGILAASRAGIDVIGIPDKVDIHDLQAPHLLEIVDSLETVYQKLCQRTVV